MNKIYLMALINIAFLINVFSQGAIKKIDLIAVNNNLLSHALSKYDLSYQMTTDGNFIYLLSNKSLFVVNTIEEKLINSFNLNFIPNNLHTFLLTSENQIGILAFDPLKINKMGVTKMLTFYRLDDKFIVYDSIQITLEENFIFLESDIYGISHYIDIEDTLILNFGGFNNWFIKNGKILPLSFDKTPGKFKIVDYKNGEIYDLVPTVVKSPDSTLIYFQIYLDQDIILNSKTDIIDNNSILPPYYNYDFPPLYLYNNQFYFNGDKKYQFSMEEKKWYNLPSEEFYYTYHLFDSGFYSYNPQNGIFTIIYIKK